MSYDLYFYKKRSSEPTTGEIASYLDKLMPNDHQSNQWFYENPDTEVYYSFEKNEPGEIDEEDELPEGFSDFEDTGFSFNINFMRPSFFGLEAFPFIEKMMQDLNLFVLNPQGSSDLPYKPAMDELFENWNKTNLSASEDHFDNTQSSFIPAEISNRVWKYNFHRKQWQEELGKDYFVPKIFFYKTKTEGKVITMATWAYHDPNVFPKVDYFFLGRQRKKWFKTITETVVIDYDTLIRAFNDYLDDFLFTDCKIIHPQNTLKAKAKFNSIRSDIHWSSFAERLSMENLYNAKPGN